MAMSEKAWGHGRGNWSRWPLGRKHGWTDLGSGVFVRPFYGEDADDDKDLTDDEVVGFYIAHKHHQQQQPRARARWHVEQLHLRGHEGGGEAYDMLAPLSQGLTLTGVVVVENQFADEPCLKGHVTDGGWVPEA